MESALGVEVCEEGRTRRLVFTSRGKVLSHRAFLVGLAESEELRIFLDRTIAEAPMRCLRWETPAITQATVDRPFECVLLDSPYLDVPANPTDFADYFTGSPGPDEVVGFPNLGHDAYLIVPTPTDGIPQDTYSHLAAFCRGAPVAQRDRLWRVVGETMLERIGEAPVWLSTAGGGVDWLHVRLDDRPKYYGHRSYRS